MHKDNTRIMKLYTEGYFLIPSWIRLMPDV